MFTHLLGFICVCATDSEIPCCWKAPIITQRRTAIHLFVSMQSAASKFLTRTKWNVNSPDDLLKNIR